MKWLLRTGALPAAVAGESDALVVVDPQGRVRVANERAREHEGLPRVGPTLTATGEVARASHELLTLEGAVVPFTRWPVVRGLEGESLQGELFRSRRLSDGREWLLSFTVEPIRDDAGQLELVVGVIRDLTRLATLQRELQESQQRYAAIYAAAPMGIALSSARTQQIENVNDAFLELFHCTREQIIGKHTASAGLLSEAERDRLFELLEREGRVREVELVREWPAGRRQWLAINLDHVLVNGEPMLLGTVRDVTRDHEERERLEQSEARYRSLFEQAAIGVVQIEQPLGRFFEVNERFCAMTGYSRTELQDLTWQAVTHPAELERDRVEVPQALAQGEPYRREKRYLRKDGSTLWARLTLLPEPHFVEGRRTVLGLVEDITEHRQVTEQLQQAQKLESIGRLAGGVAHDFNNLLTVILACCETLELDLSQGVTPALDEVKEIAHAGRRAQALTRQLLAFARKQLTEPVSVSLNDVVEESLKLLGRLVGEDVRVERVLAPESARTWADPGQLVQVLVNLAVNARDAMPRGGVLRFETGQRSWAPPHPRAGDWVLLAVSDTGEGMTEEARAHLFEPFFTTKEPGRGTGLGLATVYGIVSSAGGFIDVTSERGQGTRFELYLPRTTRPAPAQAPPAVAPARGSEVVLVVEDEPQVRDVTLRALRAAGYEVHGTGGPSEALALPASLLARVQVLVTDVVMPGMDGKALAERLRAGHPTLRVLFVSGYTRDAALDDGALGPGASFLPKPFTAASLLARVRAVLDGA